MPHSYGDLMDYLLSGIAILLVLLLGIVFWVAVQDSKRPTFELVKAEWECVETVTKTYTVIVPVGKVLVPQIRHRDECNIWKRNSTK